MATGTIILLNGTSSSGKSTTASALQQMLTEPFLRAGVDTFLYMIPEGGSDTGKRYLDIRTKEIGPPPVFEPVIEPLGWRLLEGMHRAIATIAQAGNNMIFDDVILSSNLLKDYLLALQGVNTLFVGVHCPLDICEQRERDRGDRQIGFARSWFPLIHAHDIYDVEVDTSILSPEACAQQIMQRLESDPPTAFVQLREKFL